MSRRDPHLRAAVHMVLANAGAEAISTLQIAQMAGLGALGGAANGPVWRELDRLARHGLADRIARPGHSTRYWRRAGVGDPAAPGDGAPLRERVLAALEQALGSGPASAGRLADAVLAIVEHPVGTGLAARREPGPPRRLHRRVGEHLPEGARFVGGGTVWANTWSTTFVQPGGRLEPAGRPLTRAEAATSYRNAAENDPDLIAYIREHLAGRDLACWCPLPATGEPDACHGAVLLQIANRTEPVPATPPCATTLITTGSDR